MPLIRESWWAGLVSLIAWGQNRRKLLGKPMLLIEITPNVLRHLLIHLRSASTTIKEKAYRLFPKLNQITQSRNIGKSTAWEDFPCLKGTASSITAGLSAPH